MASITAGFGWKKSSDSLDNKLFWTEMAKGMKRCYGFKPQPEIVFRDGMQVLQSRGQIEGSQRALFFLSIPGVVSAGIFFTCAFLDPAIWTLHTFFGFSLLLTLGLANGKMASKVDFFRQYEALLSSGGTQEIFTKVYKKSSRERLSVSGRSSNSNLRRESTQSQRSFRGSQLGSQVESRFSHDMANFKIPAVGGTADYCGGVYKHNIEIKKDSKRDSLHTIVQEKNQDEVDMLKRAAKRKAMIARQQANKAKVKNSRNGRKSEV